MLKFCNPDQDLRKDRHLKRYLKRGRKSVSECAAKIGEIEQLFNDWRQKTNCLLKALDETVGLFYNSYYAENELNVCRQQNQRRGGC
jgi:hypothetical protein